MSPWLLAAKAIIQPIAGALPALILVIFAGLLGLLALACEEHRRDFALAYASQFISLATVLVGAAAVNPAVGVGEASGLRSRDGSLNQPQMPE